MRATSLSANFIKAATVRIKGAISFSIASSSATRTEEYFEKFEF